MLRAIRAIGAAALLSFVLAAPASAAPGQLDPSFSGDGLALVDLNQNFENASSIAVAPDGGIVLAGNWSKTPDHGSYLMKLLPSGGFDPAFGFGGLRNFPALCSAGTSPFSDLEVLPDGRILTAGECEDKLMLRRFNADGTDDLTFDGDKGNPGGGNGVVMTVFPFAFAASSLAVDPGGAITVGGLVTMPEQTTAFARYDSEGRLDKGFDGFFANPGGGDGKVVIANPGATLDRAEDLVSLGGGRVAWVNESKGDTLVGVLGPDGKPDPSFSGDGLATQDIGGPDESDALAVDALGRLTAAVRVGNGTDAKFGAVRFLSNGEPDPSFTPPVVDTRPGLGEAPLKVLAAPDGRTYLIGYGFEPISELLSVQARLVVVALTPTGALDTSFAAGGIAVLSSPQGGAVGGSGAIDQAGRLLVSGRSTTYPTQGPNDVLVARLLTASDPVTGPPPPSNRFKFAGFKRNRAKGTATLFVEVPGAGEVKLAKTKKVKGATKKATKAGKVGIKIALRTKAKSALALLAEKKAPGPARMKLKLSVTYTPTGGTALTLPKKLSLVKRVAFAAAGHG